MTEQTTEQKTNETKDQTNEVLKEIRDKLNTPPVSSTEQAPDPAAIREKIKEETGLTDAQLDFIERDRKMAVMGAVAPLQEKVAWSDLKEKVGGIDPEVKRIMDDELKAYPPERRGDPVLLEKVYYMGIGRATASGKYNPNPAPSEEDDVVSRRVVAGRGSLTGLSTGSGSSKPKISAEEDVIRRKMNISEEEWMSSKSTSIIGNLKKK